MMLIADSPEMPRTPACGAKGDMMRHKKRNMQQLQAEMELLAQADAFPCEKQLRKGSLIKDRLSPGPSETAGSMSTGGAGGMTHFSAFHEKPTPAPHRRTKRDQAAIRQAMLDAVGPGTARSSPASALPTTDNFEAVGLPLGKLEEQRWGVSPPVAQKKLREVGLPYEGRRAGLIYSWPSIFQAEGVDAELAKNATRETHPHLFDDLMDTAAAATLLGFRDASSIRKLIIAKQLSDSALIRFGSRGVFRVRPAALQALRIKYSVGRIV